MIFHSMWLCVSLVRLFPGIWPNIGWFHKMSSFTTKVKDGPQQMTYNVQQNTTLFDPFFQRGFERTDKGGSLNSSLHADPFFVVSLTRSPRAIRNRLARLFLLGEKISVKHPWWANTFRKRIIFGCGWCLDDRLAKLSAQRAPVFGIGAVWSSMNGTFWVDEIVTWPSTSINTTQWFEAPTPVDIEQERQRFGMKIPEFFLMMKPWVMSCCETRGNLNLHNVWKPVIFSDSFCLFADHIFIFCWFQPWFSIHFCWTPNGLIQVAVMFGRIPGDTATASLTVLWRSCLRRQGTVGGHNSRHKGLHFGLS